MKGGRYLLLEEFGKGVFSHVFKAQDKINEETVVIKIYKPYTGSTNFAAHAKEEIDILKHLEPIDKSANSFGIIITAYFFIINSSFT